MTRVEIGELTRFDYEQALEVGGACNLCGVAQSFAKVMCKILKATRGTDEANRHPIAVLYAEQIAWLTSGSCTEFEASSKARTAIAAWLIENGGPEGLGGLVRLGEVPVGKAAE